MFSGIVAATGRIRKVERRKGGLRLTVDAGTLGLRDVAIGDSIAVNGICLTVVARARKSFAVDVSRETLRCTAGLDEPGEINLEKALRMSDRLGGHLVSGHVDGVGKVTHFGRAGANRLLRVRAPRALARYIARKGSIAIDGISLTVNEVDKNRFGVNIIPQTWTHTTLGGLKVGGQVNLEVDLIARYLERLIQERG